ncbi:hypothetical protein BTO14_15390 [Polaribacter butkevichii]|uniref:Uncharacterized protein n=1 Tax=Polaribacter butkevichii TaxID=218490 RepID=A0A2P6C910_9FLAO|nr:hypothetical protein BTO14_15390 [Polaribacter butkevichii]
MPRNDVFLYEEQMGWLFVEIVLCRLVFFLLITITGFVLGIETASFLLFAKRYSGKPDLFYSISLFELKKCTYIYKPYSFLYLNKKREHQKGKPDYIQRKTLLKLLLIISTHIYCMKYCFLISLHSQILDIK